MIQLSSEIIQNKAAHPGILGLIANSKEYGLRSLALCPLSTQVSEKTTFYLQCPSLWKEGQ